MTFIQNNPLSRRKSSPCNTNGDEKTISEIREEPGSSNAGKYPDSDKFCGPAGGAAKGSYPVEKDGKLDMGRISAAKSYADNAPDPSGIIACANRWEKEYEKEKGSVSRRSSQEEYIPTDDIAMDDGMADYSTQALEDQNKGLSRHGSMKGDQSATKSDYANYKDTDPHYHGHDGESHRDQSATRRDYMGNMGRHHIDPRTKR
tara:strand:+ start:3571 stop:4179 length:609 start_codon:yes stop_codon:yes gene_type:complete